jgi:hypothetical protein
MKHLFPLRNYFKVMTPSIRTQYQSAFKFEAHARGNSNLKLLKFISFLFVFFAFLISGNSQTYDGYTLYAVQNGTKAYLTDMTGTTYHTWTFSSSSTTCYSTYLLAGGALLRTINHSGNSFSGGPVSGEVQKVDWNGNITWDYVYSTTAYCSHHDIHPMPNGNVLLIAYEAKTAAEATAAGCSQSIIMWPDKIVEIQPSGTTGGIVVWEWHTWDHLVQHYDATKNNYGVIASHPELLNINYNTSKDWMHVNGIDYNATLDQITFSSHNMNEVYVIDHSTTTAQAATHSGGNSGKGGDFLYRWGNPAAYETSGTTDFNVVHDAHWVPSDNLLYPNALCGFNNKGGSGSKSCVDIFSPPYNGYNYSLTAGMAFAPSTYTWRHTYSGTATQDMGNSQQFPNGNTLVCIAQSGLIYEINSSQTQVWSKAAGGIIPKAYRYPPCFVTGSYSATASATSIAICSGSSTQLNVTATGGVAYTYSWTSSPSGFTSSLQSPTVSPTVTTTYIATITNGPCSATATVTVIVNNSPTVLASATPNSICYGTSSQLNAAVSGGTTYTYSWTSNPAGFTSTLQNPVVSPTVNTTYTVAVTSNGCTSNSLTTVTIKVIPSVIVSATPSQVCAGTSSQLYAAVSGGVSYTYAWTSIPVGFMSTVQNPVVSPIEITTYSVTVTSAGCTATGAATINVSSPITTTASASPISVNLGQSSQLNALATGGTTYTYSWTSTPVGFTSTLQNPAVTPSMTTNYSVTVTSGVCSAINSVTVTQTGVSPTLSVTPSIQYVPVSSGTTTFSVTSNSPWTVSSDQLWCNVTTSGSGNGSIAATYSENTNVSSRSANITVTVNGLVALVVVVTQDGLSPKTLNLTLFLEGLYNGATMNKAQNESGAQFQGTVADQITIELHNSTSPYAIAGEPYTVDVNTDGTAYVTIPATLSASYYIVLKHRNSIETWNSSPISFSGTTISYNFSDAINKAYGNNLKLISGKYLIFGGDVNQDGILDSGDMTPTDNDASNFVSDYISTDVNGDGIIDCSDMILLDNNMLNFVSKITPE